MAKRPRQYFEIEIEVAGEKRQGSYYVEGSVVHVHSGYGSKATQLGGMRAEALAGMLLRELVEEERRRTL